MFQSAPLTKARGDLRLSIWRRQLAMFQSAPLTKARGDGYRARIDCVDAKFQSAPLTKARGDLLGRAKRLSVEGFNPLPSQKQGETQTRVRLKRHRRKFQSAPLTKARGDAREADINPSWISFNPLPSQKQGETWTRAYSYCFWTVSIRSPHKSKGRLASDIGSHSFVLFQSAPLTKARGDTLAAGSALSVEKFQSAPLTKARGDVCRAAHWAAYGGFNPLPSQKQGETHETARGRDTNTVSIRSPHKSKGRPPPPYPKIAASGFQSAPLTKARGDPAQSGQTWPNLCFNPLPSQKQGETRRLTAQGSQVNVSIRSPHKSKGRLLQIIEESI